MEMLTAFVCERARWEEPEPSEPEMAARSGPSTPATDIAAVLEVLRRRPDAGRERETLRNWRLDLRMTNLRGADLRGAHLEGTDLMAQNLERADQRGDRRRQNPAARRGRAASRLAALCAVARAGTVFIGRNRRRIRC